LNDAPVLLELRKHFLSSPVPKTERFRPLLSTLPILLHGCSQEAFCHEEKHFNPPGIGCLGDFDRTPCL
jgi:hypothetical protein